MFNTHYFITHPFPDTFNLLRISFEIIRSMRRLYYNNIVLPVGYARARTYVSIEHAAAEHAPRPSAATAVYYMWFSESVVFFFRFTSFPSVSRFMHVYNNITYYNVYTIVLIHDNSD